VVKLDADQDETILVKVSSAHGKKPLDLDLLATNGDRVFEGKGESTPRCDAGWAAHSFSEKS
jgi:hypothetical protein